MHTKWTSVAAAVDSIPDDSTVVISPTCGTPTALVQGLTERCLDRNIVVMSGLIFDPTPLLRAVESHGLRWNTWHPSSACNEQLTTGAMDYVPLRASQVPKHIMRVRPTTAVVRVTPPDRHGWCSLGPSVGYAFHAVRAARIVIAEVDPSMPRTWGHTMVHLSDLDFLCESDTPMPVYEGATPDATSRDIADNIIELLPDQPVIQIGIGKIPESLVHELAQRGVGGLRFTGMGCDAMVDLAEAGLLQPGEADQHAITSPDLLGTPRLMQFADDNPSVGLYPSSFSHSPISLSAHERFVSINSAVEVDLTGQVNAETVKGRRVSGVGGSLDFSEGATHSQEGLRIVALPASRIVEQLGSGSVVTMPRSAVDMVVTERGVARLEGLTERERASALTGIAGDALTQIP